jgi:hypothetical protein
MDSPITTETVDYLCPFCGEGHLLMFEEEDRHWVGCLSCRACGPCSDDRMEALLAWTDRADLDPTFETGARRTVLFS